MTNRALRILLAAALITAPAAFAAPAASAARAHTAAAKRPRHQPPPPSPGGTGYDISYPQCGRAYPTGQAFGVVGVNGGLANNANSCLSSELSWASSSPGASSPSQPPASLYENTADPGNGVADWPRSGTSTTYGTCDGSWSTACAYLYGEQRAAYAYSLVSGTQPYVSPATAPWWLDIETANSWATSASTSNWAALNIATLRGFVDGLRSAGAGGPVGFYSTAYQWQSITGLTASSSSTYFPAGEPDWVAGAGSSTQARSNCSASFTGAPVKLAQFAQSGFDGDLVCS